MLGRRRGANDAVMVHLDESLALSQRTLDSLRNGLATAKAQLARTSTGGDTEAVAELTGALPPADPARSAHGHDGGPDSSSAGISVWVGCLNQIVRRLIRLYYVFGLFC